MKYTSVGFDLDGTLWNSLGTIIDGWTTASREFGLKVPTYDELRSVMGFNRRQLMDKLYPGISPEIEEPFLERCNSLCDSLIAERGAVLYDGLEETLALLSSSVSLYIASNCQEGYIERFLDRYSLGKYFCDYRFSGQKCISKGENIRELIKSNGFESSVFVGDTQGDRDAARDAGVEFIYAAYGFGCVDSYNYKIESFRELKELILG